MMWAESERRREREEQEERKKDKVNYKTVCKIHTWMSLLIPWILTFYGSCLPFPPALSFNSKSVVTSVGCVYEFIFIFFDYTCMATLRHTWAVYENKKMKKYTTTAWIIHECYQYISLIGYKSAHPWQALTREKHVKFEADMWSRGYGWNNTHYSINDNEIPSKHVTNN